MLSSWVAENKGEIAVTFGALIPILYPLLLLVNDEDVREIHFFSESGEYDPLSG